MKYSALLRARMRVADYRNRGPYQGWPDKNRCVFLHVPKTAGTSISAALGIDNARHVSWQEYYFANPRKFQSYFKFTFVRNPWDRLVSAYSYLQSGGVSDADAMFKEKWLSKFLDFEDFVLNGLSNPDVRRWVHFQTQSSFVCGSDGRTVTDRVFRFERLESEMVDLETCLGRSFPELKKANASERRHYRLYYTDVSARAVAEFYRDDIRAFGYHF